MNKSRYKLFNFLFLFTIVNILIKVTIFFFDSRIRLFSDSGTYLAAANAWNHWNHLAFFRDRTTFFTIFWSKVIDSDSSPILVVILNSTLSICSGIAALIFLRMSKLNEKIIFGGITLFIESPIFLYYERVLLPEIIGINICLILFSYQFYIFKRISQQKILHFLLLGFILSLASVLVKTNILLIWFSWLAGLVIFQIKVSNHKFWRKNALKIISSYTLGGLIGILIGSNLMGVAYQMPSSQYLKSNRAMSSYNLVFKYGTNIDCKKDFGMEVKEIVQSLCSMQNPSINEANFDQIMWQEPFLSDWGASDYPDFFQKSSNYRKLAVKIILDRPLKVFEKTLLDATVMLNPVNSPRFTTAEYPQDVWLSINSKIKFPKFAKTSSDDLLFRLSALHGLIRIALIVLIFVTLFIEVCLRIRSNVLVKSFMTSWLVYLLILSTISFPSPRYLIYSDIFILLALLDFISRVTNSKSVDKKLST